uniref:DUF7351 domain-containing protein n=1 Tax=Halocatena halophila TaxID=2814576 RepID=UPI002ED3CDBF
MELYTGVVGMIEQHSAVVSLFDDYNIDIREMMPWEFRSYVPRGDVTVRSKEPLQIEVLMTIDGDEFTVHVGENMKIVDIES